ncbi:MAG: hypothetical protein Q4E12_06695 [Coriobacteriia bacterium]|nr:hypothetical protein [Coriobacteriia bacterium]
MEKTQCTTIQLDRGIVSVYDFGGIKLHAYKTNDPIDDEVFVLVRDGRGAVIELPCFFDNIAELEGYLAARDITVEGILAPYHMAGGTFLKGTPVYETAESDKYGRNGGGAALISNFTAAFGNAFDPSLPETTIIEGDGLTVAGIEFGIVRNHEAYDITIPAINCVYTHMLGHDCHSIVAGAGHADAIIAQLEGYQKAGYDLVLTSHYIPEDLKDVQTKIDYLKRLKAIAATCSDVDAFKAAVKGEFAEYAGDNYLDMTAGFFFAE